jgi:cytochrome c peroxidase
LSTVCPTRTVLEIPYRSYFRLLPIHIRGERKELTIDHVSKAIASFERTLVSGNSAFDRYYFKGQADAITEAQVRGFQLFIGQGRCVSCHTIEQDHAPLLTAVSQYHIGNHLARHPR